MRLLACWCALFASAAKLVLYVLVYSANGIRNFIFQLVLRNLNVPKNQEFHFPAIFQESLCSKNLGIKFPRNKGKCPRVQPLGKFLKIPDSIALYTKKMCTIAALLKTQTKHINKWAIKSLNFFNEVLLNKIMTTVKIWPQHSSEQIIAWISQL